MLHFMLPMNFCFSHDYFAFVTHHSLLTVPRKTL